MQQYIKQTDSSDTLFKEVLNDYVDKQIKKKLGEYYSDFNKQKRRNQFLLVDFMEFKSFLKLNVADVAYAEHFADEPFFAEGNDETLPEKGSNVLSADIQNLPWKGGPPEWSE